MAENNWFEQCKQRKAWIKTFCDEWRARVAARSAAMAQWDAHVEEARSAYRAAKLVPVPPRPW